MVMAHACSSLVASPTKRLGRQEASQQKENRRFVRPGAVPTTGGIPFNRRRRWRLSLLVVGFVTGILRLSSLAPQSRPVGNILLARQRRAVTMPSGINTRSITVCLSLGALFLTPSSQTLSHHLRGLNSTESLQGGNEGTTVRKQAKIADRPPTWAQAPGLPGVALATDDRLQYPGWWPTKGMAARSDYVGPTACAGCHAAKGATQKDTPMARASARAANSDALRAHDRLTFEVAPFTYQIARAETGPVYSVTDGTHSISEPLLWAFGLGESGETYIFRRNGIFYESRLSYFSALQRLDFTPGASRTASANVEDALGRRMMDPSEPRHCFGCHSTAATTSGRFDPDQEIPGVTCEACHGPGRNHVTSMMAGQIQEGTRWILNPSRLGPVDSVDFCGACHRTTMDVGLSGKHGILNLRFQPYRLQASRCWDRGDTRITCIACHDPHQPRVRNSEWYDERCLRCHQSTATVPEMKADHFGSACPVSTNNCVTCHMPKYEMPGMHFKFTDHYIRIVRKGDSYVD